MCGVAHPNAAQTWRAQVEKQEQVWKEALASNGIISHNPNSPGGGCFSSYFEGGGERLIKLLHESDATVISWTRNNVLRQRYSLWLAAQTSMRPRGSKN